MPSPRLGEGACFARRAACLGGRATCIGGPGCLAIRADPLLARANAHMHAHSSGNFDLRPPIQASPRSQLVSRGRVYGASPPDSCEGHRRCYMGLVPPKPSAASTPSHRCLRGLGVFVGPFWSFV